MKEIVEIRNDFIDEDLDQGFKAIYIDGWFTEDENEEGLVIAKVYGNMIKGKPVIFHDFVDYTYIRNAMVHEAIKEAKKDMLEIIEGD